MSADPLSDIEDRKGQQDVGVAAFRIFAGARAEGATRYEAALVVYAWFRSSLESTPSD